MALPLVQSRWMSVYIESSDLCCRYGRGAGGKGKEDSQVDPQQELFPQKALVQWTSIGTGKSGQVWIVRLRGNVTVDPLIGRLLSNCPAVFFPFPT